MSPIQLKILLHYCGSAEDFRGGDFSAPAVRDAIDAFRGDLGMLEPDDEIHGRTYRLTPRGECFIDYLTSLPLPVQTWTMPERGAEG